MAWCDALPIPTFTGRDAQLALLHRYGIPQVSAQPELGDHPFGFGGGNRDLFVDDFDNGRPIAYWRPELSRKMLEIKLRRRRRIA